MKFRTAFDGVKYQPENPRHYSKTEPQYRMELNPDSGLKELVEVGQVNVYAIKQEAAKDCNIYNQIDRFNRTGDASFLGQTVDGFIDTLQMPKSLMEIENVRAKASQLWAAAPRQIREQYGSNIEKFLKDVDKKLADRAAEKLAAQRAAAKGESVHE